jgi:hypothetical protein
MRCGKLRDAWPSAAKAAISMGAQAARLEVAPFPFVAGASNKFGRSAISENSQEGISMKYFYSGRVRLPVAPIRLACKRL